MGTRVDTRGDNFEYRRVCPFKGGLPAAVLPPPQLRTPMFARCNELSSLSYMYPRIAVAGHVFEHSFGGPRGLSQITTGCVPTHATRYVRRQSRKPEVPGSNPR